MKTVSELKRQASDLYAQLASCAYNRDTARDYEKRQAWENQRRKLLDEYDRICIELYHAENPI